MNSFCGQTVNGAQLDKSKCTYPCTGNKSEICGGDDILSVYQDTTFRPVDSTEICDYVPLGCYTDNSKNGRTLSYPMDTLDSTKMTTESCLTACKSRGFPFAGTEYGGELALHPLRRRVRLTVGQVSVGAVLSWQMIQAR